MYESCKAYIADYWKKITCFHPRDNKTRIGLPHHFISPNDTFFKDDQFYWDTYFICEGLLARDEVHLVKGIVENFLFLFRKYGVIPLRNQLYNLGISQPPFLSSLVWSVYKRTNDKIWLTEMIFFLEEELLQYWMDGGVVGKHLLATGLSRYCDHEITHVTAEHESGWDMTSRFHEHCLHFAPVDLNSLLYKYEIDLAKMFDELDNHQKANEYRVAAAKRKELVTRYCWHEEIGFFFDYNHYTKTQSTFFSLAGFYPLWTGLASDEQARRMRKQLSVFECEGGLANTQSHNLSEEFKQWDYPNGWPNQQYIVIFGLQNYGFVDDAKRLAKKWLDLNDAVFKQTGVLWEKYDVVALSKGKRARYETQSGFAWTNAVFILLYDFLNES